MINNQLKDILKNRIFNIISSIFCSKKNYMNKQINQSLTINADNTRIRLNFREKYDI